MKSTINKNMHASYWGQRTDLHLHQLFWTQSQNCSTQVHFSSFKLMPFEQIIISILYFMYTTDKSLSISGTFLLSGLGMITRDISSHNREFWCLHIFTYFSLTLKFLPIVLFYLPSVHSTIFKCRRCEKIPYWPHMPESHYCMW